MVIRENADIGSVVIGDIHKKSKCAQLRLAEAIEFLASFRRTQLNLLLSGLGLQEPTDDIAEDVAATRTLIGEFPKSIQGSGLHSPKGFVTEVQDAMNMEGLDLVVLVPPSHKDMEVRDSSCTQNLADSPKDMVSTDMKTVSSPAPLSPDGLLCTMHAKSPCTPTGLRSRSTGGPWFQRTPALSLTRGTPATSVTRELEFPTLPVVGGDNSVCSTERAGTKDFSCVSELVEAPGQKLAKKRGSSTLLDNSQDDVISRTTHKSDGR